MSNDKTAEEIPVWYTYSEMYDRLIRENYSKEIAKELSHKWANDLQGAFSKGYEKAQRHSAQQLKEYKAKLKNAAAGRDLTYFEFLELIDKTDNTK